MAENDQNLCGWPDFHELIRKRQSNLYVVVKYNVLSSSRDDDCVCTRKYVSNVSGQAKYSRYLVRIGGSASEAKGSPANLED